MKEDIIKSLKDDIDKLVDSRTKELDDRKRRDCNGLLFNLPEPRRQGPEENKKSDEDDVKALSMCLGLENLHILILFRLGRLTVGNCRPLKVVLQSKAHKKYLLDNAKYIQEKAPQNMKKINIVRDFTPGQRQERRDRFASRRNSDQNNQPNRGRVTNQNQISQNQHAVVEVNDNLSPVFIVSPVCHVMSSTHLSQINHYTDSQPVRGLSAVYNETTVIERTLIGGMS